MTLQYSAGNQYILQWDAGNGGHNLTLENVTLTGTSNGNAGSGNLSAIAGADGLTLTNLTYNVTTTAITPGPTTFIFGSGNDITVTAGTTPMSAEPPSSTSSTARTPQSRARPSTAPTFSCRTPTRPGEHAPASTATRSKVAATCG